MTALSADYPTLAFHASVTNPFGKGALINLLRQFSKVWLSLNLWNNTRKFQKKLPTPQNTFSGQLRKYRSGLMKWKQFLRFFVACYVYFSKQPKASNVKERKIWIFVAQSSNFHFIGTLRPISSLRLKILRVAPNFYDLTCFASCFTASYWQEADQVRRTFFVVAIGGRRALSPLRHPRLDYQPLFGKGARAPPPNSSLLGEGRPDTRERRKSSLCAIPASQFHFRSDRDRSVGAHSGRCSCQPTRTSFLY